MIFIDVYYLDNELILRHKNLFRDYFKNETELEDFILVKLSFTGDNTPRIMINTVQRLVTLSDEMDKIRHDRRDLSIFFIVTCIHALYSLVPNLKMKKQDMVIDFFDRFLDQTDRDVIEKGISISTDEELFYKDEISINEFALLMNSIRNNVAHEGIYWSFHFNPEDYDGRTLSIVKSKLMPDEGYRKITYHVGITYTDFRNACMKAFISFLNNYYSKLCNGNQCQSPT